MPRSSYAFVLLFFGVLGLALPAAAAPADISVLPSTPLRIERDVEILFEQPGENLTRERVMATDMAQRWAIYPRKMVNILGERRPIWLRFALRSQSDQQRILWIGWPVLSDVRFSQYLPGDGVWGSEFQAGLAHPKAPKIQKDPNPIFPVMLQADKRTVVLLRLQGATSVAAPMVLWDEKDWQAGRFDYLLAMGFLFGILSVMCFYNLSLYVFSRERSYGLYSGYLLTVIAYQLCVTGLGPLLIWPGNEWFVQRGYEFFASITFLSATLFTRTFLNIRERAPWYLDWLSRGFIAFFAVVSVLLLFEMPVAVPLSMPLAGFFGGIVGICTAAYLALRGDLLARYFVIAWTTIIGATTVLLMALAGVVEPGGWMIYIQPIGYVLETVLFSVALAERIKRERLAKEAAWHESHELSQKVQLEREEKLQAQEHALAVQVKANEELEVRVLDRTAALKQAMDNVELANRELARLSVTDALTGVHNRRYFDETLTKEYDRMRRGAGPLALLMIDIDFFKKINDTVGHLGGDECLKLVASTLTTCVGRTSDLVARYGGEEFAAVLPGLDESQAMLVAERIRKAVEDIQFIYRGRRVPISVSLGVAVRMPHADTPMSDFIGEADRALYAAKEAGRNRAIFAKAA